MNSQDAAPPTTGAVDQDYNSEWIVCWNCGGEVYVDHDCGEDTCCCLYPEDNVVCDVCAGAGGWETHENEAT